MGNSDSITVDVTKALSQTFFVNFDVQPRSVRQDGGLTFSGYLSLNATAPAEQPDPVSGELISLEIFDGTNWVPTGQTAVTIPDGIPPVYHYGYFNKWFALDPAYMQVGVWQFRAHYDGNDAKGLEGCEKNTVSVAVGTLDLTPYILAGVGLGIAGLTYLVIRK